MRYLLFLTVCRIVEETKALANLDWVKRQIKRGRELVGGKEADRYAALDLADKLPFPFLHRVMVPQQIREGSGEVPIVFMMTTRGRGSGLHVAREMSVPGGDLYYSTAYLDAQKVTVEEEMLMRLSTYSPRQRRMMTVAEAMLPSESQRHSEAFLGELSSCCMKGTRGVEGEKRGEGFWAEIPPFRFSAWRRCQDAAQGPNAAYEKVIGIVDGRGEGLSCEMHWKKDKRNAEQNLPEDLRDEHDTLVRIVLASRNGGRVGSEVGCTAGLVRREASGEAKGAGEDEQLAWVLEVQVRVYQPAKVCQCFFVSGPCVCISSRSQSPFNGYWRLCVVISTFEDTLL